jgi:myo-inositol-1(or 4)-monophosphatase
MDFARVIELVKAASDFTKEDALREKITVKGEANFVTEVDIQINNFLKKRLWELDESIGFFSEEEKGRLTDPCWILDPIDGTTNLILGYKLCSISLALFMDGEVKFGVVYNPFSGETFTAKKGAGAYLGGKKLRVSSRAVRESVVEFGAGSTHKEEAELNFKIARRIFENCLDIRRICSSALDLCFIADARIDGYFEKVLKPWDIAAGSLVLSEAGGKLTDYSGRALQFAKSTSVIASNGTIHNFLEDMIKGVAL